MDTPRLPRAASTPPRGYPPPAATGETPLVRPNARQTPPEPLPLHARVRGQLYGAVDHLTFRGTFTPLLSGSLKLAMAAIAGHGGPLRDTLWLGASGSGLQALMGAVLPGDREHGFTWVSTLKPSLALEPPDTVRQWQLVGTDTDQRRLAGLRHALAQPLPEHPPRLLQALQEQLRQCLRTERDMHDLFSATVAVGTLLFDALVAAQAQRAAQEDQLRPGAFQAILALCAISLLLDFLGCRWQMSTRRPLPETYPRPPRAGPAARPAPITTLTPAPPAEALPPEGRLATRPATLPQVLSAAAATGHGAGIDSAPDSGDDSEPEDALTEQAFRTRAPEAR